MTTAAQTRQAPNGWPQELLEGFREGRRDALATVYRMHVDEVVRLLRRGFNFSSGGQTRRFVGYAGPFDLQDAVQETFRLAFEPRARAGYDGLRPYGPYLRTIARNVVLQAYRTQARRFPVLTAEGTEKVEAQAELETGGGADDPGPARWVQEQQVRDLVQAFLEQLGAEDRQLVELRFVQGLSQRDAAEALGIGRQRIRTKELRLRRRLLGYLRARGELGLVEGVTAVLGTGLLELVAEGLR